MFLTRIIRELVGNSEALRIRKRTFLRLQELESRDVPSTFTVTNTSSSTSDVGSLPWAVQEANYYSPGLDYINFNISGSGIHIITISSTLYLNDQVVINGTTQSGYNGSPLIYIVGSSSVSSLFLLQAANGTSSSGSTIEGLGMYDYGTNGVTIFNSSSGDYVQSNWIGFYPNASTILGYENIGVSQYCAGIGVASSYDTLRYNTICGTYNAINMGEDPLSTWSGTVYSSNSITFNTLYGNTSDGIFLGSGSQYNYLGPTNMISGNGVHGVEIFAGSADYNVVFQNYIGTDFTGKTALGNGQGVLICYGATGNAVGGSFGGNIISANTNGGVQLGADGFGAAYGNYVSYNVFGMDSSESYVIGGQAYAISINTGSAYNQFYGNVVTGSTSNGIQITNAYSNYIYYNYIGLSPAGYGYYNYGFGVALNNSANYNYVFSNGYGLNYLGYIYVDAGAYGNYIA